ncbi:MAG: hypothetical protein WCO96_07020 [Actinomycetes bacterium]
MDSIDIRAALRAAAAILVVFIVVGGTSALLLPHSAFEDWGVLIGPAAWIVGAIVAARAAGLGVREAVYGSLAAVVPNAIAGMVGLHWVGVAVGAAVFATVCGWFAARKVAPTAG